MGLTIFHRIFQNIPTFKDNMGIYKNILWNTVNSIEYYYASE